jgi:hypothetical protein
MRSGHGTLRDRGAKPSFGASLRGYQGERSKRRLVHEALHRIHRCKAEAGQCATGETVFDPHL